MAKDAVKLSDFDIDRVDAVDKPATKSRFLILKSEDADELRKNIQGLADGTDGLLDLIEKDAPADEVKQKAADLGKLLGRTATAKAGPANQADCEAIGGAWTNGACTMPQKGDAAKAAEKTVEKAAVKCTKCAAPVAEGKFVAKGEVRKGDTCPMCGAPVDGEGNYSDAAPADVAAAAKSADASATAIAAEVAKALAPALAKIAESNAAVAKAIETAPKAISKSDAPKSRQAAGDDDPEKPIKKSDGKVHFDSVVFGQN